MTAPAQVDVDARAPQLPIDASQVPVTAALGALGARRRGWAGDPRADAPPSLAAAAEASPESEVKLDGGYAEAPLEGERQRRLGGWRTRQRRNGARQSVLEGRRRVQPG